MDILDMSLTAVVTRPSMVVILTNDVFRTAEHQASFSMNSIC